VAIEAVLFDYSGVLTTGLNPPTENVDFDPDALYAEMIAGLASSDPHPWHDLERGQIALDQFVTYIEEKVPGASTIFAVDGEHNAMANLTLLDERLALATDLKKQGLRVGLVTNNVAEWKSLWLPGLPEGLFEIVIDSADVGCRKPEPEIYQLAMEQLAINDPATVLFIDDFEWNVTGATDVGMIGLHCGADIDLRTAVSDLLAT